VILCERGVRTFADHTRNTLDLSICARGAAAEPSADPGGFRATVRASAPRVLPLSRAAIAVGRRRADHRSPRPILTKALSDGMQSILPEQFTQLMDECSQIATVLHRRIPRGIHVEESAGVPVTAR